MINVMQSSTLSRTEGVSGSLQRSQPRVAATAAPNAQLQSRVIETNEGDTEICIAAVIENRVKEVRAFTNFTL